MDGALAGWYFSTVRRVHFDRTKYGRELLVDAGYLRRLPGFIFLDQPYTLDFHDLVLVTRGRGTFTLDGRTHRVAPGTLVFTRPGEVRRFAVPGLDGACLFFAEEFVAEAFADARFLDRFACFRAGRPSPVLALTAARRRRFLAMFRPMQREIALLPDDVSDALRAKVYDLLVTVDRWYVARWGAPPAPAGDVVWRFIRMVERDFAQEHRVAAYARRLGVSPGHLSALCRRELGRNAGRCVRARLALEARRLLAHTGLTAAEVGHRLGFDDPAYFARFFRREAGEPPSAYRGRRSTSRAGS
jgi:AraC-like DNA-binding protein